jgi:hypothetical protein
MSDDTLALAPRAVALGLTVGDREMQAWGRPWSMDTNAWLLTRGNDIAPIPSTRRVARVEENAAAAEEQPSASGLDIASLARVLRRHVDPADMARGSSARSRLLGQLAAFRLLAATSTAATS